MAAGPAGSLPRRGDWLAGVLITGAFAVMWLVCRRRARRGGVGRPAGFGAAAGVGLCFTMSLGLIAMAFAGPFLVFGLGLLAADEELASMRALVERLDSRAASPPGRGRVIPAGGPQ